MSYRDVNQSNEITQSPWNKWWTITWSCCSLECQSILKSPPKLTNLLTQWYKVLRVHWCGATTFEFVWGICFISLEFQILQNLFWSGSPLTKHRAHTPNTTLTFTWQRIATVFTPRLVAAYSTPHKHDLIKSSRTLMRSYHQTQWYFVVETSLIKPA